MADSPCLGPWPLTCMSRAVFYIHFTINIFKNRLVFIFKIKQGVAKMTDASILVGNYDICSGKRQKTKLYII